SMKSKAAIRPVTHSFAQAAPRSQAAGRSGQPCASCRPITGRPRVSASMPSRRRSRGSAERCATMQDMTDVAKDWYSPDFQRLPGFVRVARIGGAAIDLHWSCVSGGLILAAAGAFRRELLIPLVVAYILVVLVHEAGHAFAGRLLGLKVYGIRLMG